ncbi:hypothetical protein OG819_21810 [Streptomyces sp. NBC_01549]|uniref:hypothetical protein n=1 Tax=Streptomyces sp. NBC_01549 TaxID=2975874 RepID=UPI00225A9A21|nr:hypothetical protein [Streptomyces sp. NBC_01549]MCX4592269.1 hypothetical protein [Streptomyces sp. NBC_01549]
MSPLKTLEASEVIGAIVGSGARNLAGDVPITYPLIAGLDSWNSYENDPRGHH